MRYRTKFYLREVTVEGNKLTAKVEPISPYLFRIREVEYKGLLAEVDEAKYILDGKLIQLEEMTTVSGDKRRCFTIEYTCNAGDILAASLAGKSADSIVEIDFDGEEKDSSVNATLKIIPGVSGKSTKIIAGNLRSIKVG